ncbi:MAG: TOMM precursor leader peptide-binding protein, partial [Dehalococcoidia bacterium]
MFERPALRPEFQAEVVEPEGVLLVSERRQAVLPGQLYARLVSVLDGSLTVGAIVDRLRPVAPATHVYLALARLEAGGYLTEAGVYDGLPRVEAAFWSALNGPAATVTPQAATVAVVTIGDSNTAPLRNALTGMGLRVNECGDLTVAVTDDPLDEGLAVLNVAALDAGRPWLLLKPSDTVPWVGPLFRPGVTGCWECLAHRVRLNRAAESFLHSRRGGAMPIAAAAAVPASIEAISALAAIEVAK